MWEYKILFEGNGKFGVYNLRANKILTSTIMEKLLEKNIPKLRRIEIVSCRMKNKRKIK